ncbi:MAG: NAD(P)-dependent oxidoreductase [Armatimonadetes bacterium]|nr:NAD(P)-dependent oxidoreductase [Armatimonadota bacterium]
MNIVVTGGCGYVGTPLTSALLQDGHTVTVIDTQWFGNFLQSHSNLQVIKEDIRNTGNIPLGGIDAVIHLANIANDPSVGDPPRTGSCRPGSLVDL